MIKGLSWLLTTISFLGSWSHCYEQVLAAGQGERLSLIIATLPEVSVLVALLAWMNKDHSLWVLLTGVGAFAFTITANWQTAQVGTWSHVVAVWPAWSAITALVLAHGTHGAENGTEGLAAPVPMTTGTRLPEPPESRPAVDVTDHQHAMYPIHTEDTLTIEQLSNTQENPMLIDRAEAVSIDWSINTVANPKISAQESSLTIGRMSNSQENPTSNGYRNSLSIEHPTSTEPTIAQQSAPSPIVMSSNAQERPIAITSNAQAKSTVAIPSENRLTTALPPVQGTTHERVVWIRSQTALTHDDIVRIFGVSTATARRYRQAAMLNG